MTQNNIAQSVPIDLPYFQPRTGQEQSSATTARRLPQRVLDMFYVRPTAEAPVELLAVIGCLVGGDLLVATGATLATLPEAIRNQWQTVQVSQRGLFRTLTANELYIFTLEAMEQSANTAGFNDAITLYGRIQAKISAGAGQFQLTPLTCEGRLTVGRLDLLNAYHSALPYVFLNPETQHEKMYQLLLPGAGWQTIAHGRSAVLVYPMLATEVAHRFDNTVFTMRIVYDLLSRLQQEMVEAALHHPFITYNLPVPSRRRLEHELMLAQYTIQGDIAVKQSSQDTQDAAQPRSWLAHLRHLAQRWSAPKIWLPPQATPEHYEELIATVLPVVTRPEDQAMAQAVARLLTAPMVSDQPSLAPTPAPIHFDQAARPPDAVQPSIAPLPATTTALRDRATWSSDFAAPATPERALHTPKWREDFNADAQPSTARLLTTNEEEWPAFLNATSANPPPPATPPVNPKQAEWSQDFNLPTEADTPAANPAAPAWIDDFA